MAHPEQCFNDLSKMNQKHVDLISLKIHMGLKLKGK
jgi:hypothetical protein